jgi:hypothetical protein
MLFSFTLQLQKFILHQQTKQVILSEIFLKISSHSSTEPIPAYKKVRSSFGLSGSTELELGLIYYEPRIRLELGRRKKRNS